MRAEAIKAFFSESPRAKEAEHLARTIEQTIEETRNNAKFAKEIAKTDVGTVKYWIDKMEMGFTKGS